MPCTANLPAKPAYMAPICNGCGVCCMNTPCPLAVMYLGQAKGQACSFLEFDEGRFWCGLLRNADAHLGANPVADAIKPLVERCIGAVGECDCDAPEGWTVLDVMKVTKP